MTDQEKRQQKAMLLLECQEAEEELAHLEERAKSLTSIFRELAEWIGRLPFPSSETSTSYGERVLGGVDLNDSKYREAMNFDALNSLVVEINKARIKVRNLKHRKDSLGLK